MIRRALVIVLVCGRVAWADDPGSDEFRAAMARAAAGDATALDALEALGAERPLTRWSDDAWSEAARLAEKRGDYTRASRDLDQAIAISTDDALLRRARAERARITGFAGAAGEWATVAAQHEQLVEQSQHGDPKPALRELAALVDAHPAYPRAALAMLVIARGWERDGNTTEARVWLERAARTSSDQHVLAELVRFTTRTGELDDARRALTGITDPIVARELDAGIARAEHRRTIRWLLWGLLAAIFAAGIVMLRRDAGAWRAAGRRLLHPPAEVWFFVPIAAVLAIVAATGNPLVARTVRAIAITGAAVAWLSGAILDGAKPLAARRALLHAGLAALAVAAATYLAIDRGQILDLVIETWRSGPAAR